MMIPSIILLVFVIGVTVPLTGNANAAISITKTQSGLVSSDSLDTGDTSNWTFAGTANSHDAYEDSQGLHIGAESPQSGQWVNYYASYANPQPNAGLFHATVSIPDTRVPDGVSNIGLYVEGSDFIPHVGCEAYADSTGYYWVVEQSPDAGQTYTILYITQPSSTPQTQDCTIITNGSNSLKVYIGGQVVFSSTSMNLGMSKPLRTYFQDDTSSSNSMHYATYSDYYTTTSGSIKVTNNPSNAATVKISDSSGQMLSTASVSSGTATLNVAKYSFPIAGSINIYDSSGNLIASSSASMYGGDTFSVTNTSDVPQSPTGLGATAVSSSQINLSWTAPADDGGSPITGYKIDRSANGGTTWDTVTSNTDSTITTYSDTGLVPNTAYTYRVAAINAIGTSIPSSTASATTNPAAPTTSTLTVNTQDSNRNTIVGYYTELYQNGNLVDSGYTPYTFTLNNGQTYTVDVIDFGNYKFDHWADTGSVTANRVISISSNTQITAIYKTVPQAPTVLTGTAISPTQINLAWAAPTDNGGSPITGYKIERSSDNGATWSILVSNTGSASTAYSDTGLVPNTAYTYRVAAINTVGTGLTSEITSVTTLVQVRSVTLAQSGLVISDSLTNKTQTKAQLLANQQFWHYGGSATVNNTPYDISRDPQGFHIGVQSANDGNWTGFYGVAPSSSATLFHAVVTTPVTTVPNANDFYENGLYVQTSTDNVNYVTCFADTGTAGTIWAIVSATGGINGATNFNLLWYDTSPNQSLTRDCTIITNGSNYLKVYLDGTMVYTNSTLDLQMPGPFIAFLEPQTSYPGQMLYGTYKDYYSTASETLKVTNNPANAARVDVVGTSGNIIASGPVSAGAATISIGQYHFPLVANIKVYDSANSVIASTASAVNIFGGNVYSVD